MENKRIESLLLELGKAMEGDSFKRLKENVSQDQHLSDTEAKSFVEKRLPASIRGAARVHVAMCEICQRKIKKARGDTLQVVVGLAAVAAMVSGVVVMGFLMWPLLQPSKTSIPNVPNRPSRQEEIAKLKPVLPEFERNEDITLRERSQETPSTQKKYNNKNKSTVALYSPAKKDFIKKNINTEFEADVLKEEKKDSLINTSASNEYVVTNAGIVEIRYETSVKIASYDSSYTSITLINGEVKIFDIAGHGISATIGERLIGHNQVFKKTDDEFGIALVIEENTFSPSEIGMSKAQCGDRLVQNIEECDDGNQVGTDDCTPDCRLATCGDSFVQGIEQCDLGTENKDGSSCEANCTLPICHNGILDTGEQCDDGNTNNEDSCVDECRKARCGDKHVQTGKEQCDTGGEYSMLCTDSCTIRFR